jgi:hypothetical protein
VVTRKERVGSNDPEGMVDDTSRRLEGVALPPMTRGDVHTEFGSARIGSVRPESAAPDVLAGGDEKDRPVLNAVALLGLDLLLKSGADLAFGQRTNGNEPSHGRITPERARKREVGFVPYAEPEA